MVERLKSAVMRARQARTQTPSARARGRHAVPAVAWDALKPVELDLDKLHSERVVTYDKSHPSYLTFDQLRTQLLKVFNDNQWSRIAITAPSKGCGKTVLSANLALSMARQPDLNTMLLDMDLRAPRLSKCLGVSGKYSAEWFLRGETPPERYLLRVDQNLALGLNTERVRDSAELVQSDMAAQTLTELQAAYRPNVMIFDMPPLLGLDDTVAFLSNVDCVLLVAAAGTTRTQEVDECERLLSSYTNFLGVVLNKSQEDADTSRYGYGYGYGYGYS